MLTIHSAILDPIMYRSNSGRGRRNGSYGSPSKTAPRGKFIDGIWHCDCDPRMPAEHFQTKNGGANHGRWFFTCQKPQPKRCKFFLWDDEAKQREKAVVLSNARSEENSKSATQTPTKTQTTLASDVGMTPSKRSKLDSTDRTLDHEDSFNWPSSEDDVFAAAESTQANSPVTPRKAAKTVQFSSPEKRSYAEISSALEDTSPSRKAAELDDVFTTPKSSTRRNGGLLSPQITPAVDRIKDGNVSKEDLVAEVLDTLSTFHLQPQIRESLIDVLNKYELRTQGIIKGREISRLAIQTKDKQISDLQARVAGLEAERETNRLVIAHLKHDISTPKRKRG